MVKQPINESVGGLSQHDVPQYPLTTPVAVPAPQRDDNGPVSRRFETEIDVDRIQDLPHTLNVTVEAVGIIVWILSLYHMTGKNEISLDLINESRWDVMLVHTSRMIQSDLSKSTTPADLLQGLLGSLAQDPVPQSSPEKLLDAEGGGHQLILLNKMPSELLAETLEDNKNHLSSVHLHLEQSNAILVAHWRDNSQDLDELLGITKRAAKFVVSQFESCISMMRNPATGQVRLANPSSHVRTQPNFITGKGQTIHGLFQETCSRWPYRKAVDAWDGSFTYAELDDVSWRWANILASHHSFAGQRVLHIFDHSRWAIVAWLAILKAGSVCVPVDVSIPEERLKSIIQGTGCKGAISDPERAPPVARLVQDILVPEDLNGAEPLMVGSRAGKQNTSLASMIMYTSGSTGEPKGAVQPHGAVASSLIRVARVLRLDETSRFLQFASHSFDVSICEIFTPLCIGGCVVVPCPKDKVGGIANNINAMRVSHALLTPTVARTFMPDDVPDLKSLSLGGERASSELRKAWSSRLDLTILYGTTETAVWDTIVHVSRRDCENSRLIGYPIGGRVWVVHPNDWTALSPIGVLGELCVQGPEIADCYLGAPELTARAFKSIPTWLPDGSGSDPNSDRIYRTGDLGRILSDGSLELWGRIDRQIKLNGQRMEPAEIEESLMRFLPRHLRVYVETLKPAGNKPRLAAFISCEENATPSISGHTKYNVEIRKAFDGVQGLLPRSMIPSVIVPLTSLPLTVSKKINRLELQKLGLAYLERERPLDMSNSADNPEHVSGRLCDPRAISQMVLNVLRADQFDRRHRHATDFSPSDNGLDSLDAVEISSMLRKAAKIEVPASFILKPGVKISDIAAASRIPRGPQEAPVIRLQRELEAWCTKLDRTSAVDGRSVLLTGASGFLGKEILRKLLEHSDQWTVICIVRGEDCQDARRRLLTAVREEAWWDVQNEQRIEVWSGNLTKPRLGLRHHQWRDIFGLYGRFRHVHTIIHNGAVVNWLESYESLSDSNVGSIFELLRGLLQSHDSPDLLFVSGGYLSGLMETNVELAAKISHLPGYDQTKFVAERIVEHFNDNLARNMESRVKIFKPGFIIGSSKDGRTQTRDALWRFVKACAQIGSYSKDDARKWIPVTGVDSVASSLITQMPIHTSSQLGSWFHKVFAGVYLQEIWDILANLGVKLHPLGHQDWLKAVDTTMEVNGRAHPLYPLKDWLATSGGYMGTEAPEECCLSDGDNVEAKVAVRKSLEYLMACGFLSERRVLD